ncbi:FxSxx-COOH system tetratricopeptide repeat protein, partial [Streptomyces sp. S6]
SHRIPCPSGSFGPTCTHTTPPCGRPTRRPTPRSRPPAGPADGTRTTARFPGTVPRLWNLSPRNPGFTGRDALLERLRDTLGTAGHAAACTLYGLGGVGKTHTALEYAHRFAADYDLVWWIPAEQGDLAASALSDLAAALGLPPGEDTTRGVLDHLRRAGPDLRWLLVLDNAEEPEDTGRYLPGGSGHVLVTSRDRTWNRRTEVLEVEPFLREESVEHLLRRAPGLAAEDAGRVAAAVGDLPLALEQAGAWLAETATPVDDYLAELDRQTGNDQFLSRSADHPHSVAATWNVSVRRLGEHSPAAARLLHLCAFFAPEPIALSLLYGDEMIRVLSAEDPALQEKLVLGRVIRDIGRFALAKADRRHATIQVHRLVQAAVRSRLTPREQAEARHIVHRVLAGARPPGEEPVDDPANHAAFAAIWPHLDACGASSCDLPETRQLLLDRIRHVWQRGDLDAALALAENLRERWEQRAQGEDGPTDLRVQLLLLRFHIANVLRSQGRYAQAVETGTDTLARQRSLLAPGHPHILMSASALATDLASVGRFHEALEMIAETYLGFKETLGEDHPRTLMADNNRAVCLRLCGRYTEAREIDQNLYEVRRTGLGPRHPHTLFSLANLGHDLRATGDYDTSVSLLRDAYESWTALFGETYPDTLRSARSLALSLRRAGALDEARTLTLQVREHHRHRGTPPTSPEVLACNLAHASDLYAAGLREEALALARDAVQKYRSALGDRHPATLAAANNHGTFLQGSGEPAEARAVLEETWGALREVLGDDHPFTSACAVNLAAVFAETGHPHRSEELERAAVAGLQKSLGPAHPDTLVARAGLSATLRALHRLPEAEQLQESARADLERLLGTGHPHTASVREGRRVPLDLEPPTV